VSSDNLRLALLISADGAAKTVAELLAIQAASKKIADEAPGIARLAGAFNLSGEAAKKLAKDLNRTPDEILQIADALKSMQRAGVSSEQQLLSLAAKFKLTGEQAKRFQGAAKGTFEDQPKQVGALGGGLGELAFKFNNIVGAVQGLAAAARPAYDYLIGANERLNAQLLSSQTNLASSTRIFQGGQEITDPTAKINASRPALQAALKQIEQDTQSLVGVTSSQVNELFQITLTNAAALSNQSKQFPDAIAAATSLTKGWAASLKVVGVPLDQARQEINSILKGQIDQNSILAKNLNITTPMVEKWKAQGILVDELNKKLNVFVAGNAIAARSIDGISSNITDLFERVAREAGQPLLEPIVNTLAELEKFLKANETEITGFLKGIADGTVNVSGVLAEKLTPLLKGLIDFAAQAAPLAENLFGLISQGLVASADLLGPLLTGLVQVIAKATEGLAALSELALLQGINDSSDAINQLTATSNALSDQAVQTGSALKALNEQQAKGIPLTAEQAIQQKRLTSQGGLLIASIDDQIKALKSVNAVGEDNRKQRDAQVASLESMKTALSKTSGSLKLQGKDLEELGTTQQQYAKKAANALNQIKNQGNGDEAVFKKSVEELIKVTAEQVKLGLITKAEAEKRLTALKNNTKIEAATQQQAKEAIAKIRKDQVDAEIATIQSGQSAIEALQAQGNLSEAEAEKQLTQLKIAEIQKRLEANRAAAETATGTEKNKLIAEEKKLQGDLDKVKAESANKERKRRVEDFDERLKVLQASFDQGKVAEGDYLKQKTQLQVQQADEEIKQQREALAKLGANDKEGREAITAKIADIESKKAKAIADGLKAQIALVDRFVQEGQAKATQAEAQRQVDIQKLVNSGAINQQQAEELKANATRDRLQQELSLAQQQIQKLAALPNPTNPEAARELENKKRAARKQTTDLTLQLLQAEAAAQERVRQAAIKAIDDAVAAKTRAYEQELAALEAVKGTRDRAAKATEAASQKEVAALDVATKAIERQNSLLSARANLQKAQSSAVTTETEIALEAINQQLQGNQKDVGLLQQKAALENQLAVQKRQALLDEQASARTSLQLEIRRNEIAAKRQLLEAQIAEAKAKQAVLDAQSALQQQRINDQKALSQAQGELDKAQKLAPGRERERAVVDAQNKVQLVQSQAGQGQANAQQQVQLAQQQVGLAGQNVQQAQEQITNTQEINQLQQQTLAIEQETALKRLDATESLRQQRIEQEAIAVAAKDEADARERSAKAGGASPAALPARRLGGPVTPGQPFLGAEEGAEAVRYGDGSYGLLSVPGVYEVPRSGMVLTARQTAALMGGKGAGVAMPKGVQAIKGDGGLLQEVRALRADLATAGSTTHNQFQIVADQDPYRRMAEIAATVNRSRWK
jgi:hypothetical protein